MPIGLSVPIFLGSLISYLTLEKNQEKGTAFASGLITGEAIMGILIAIPIFLTGISNWWQPILQFNSNVIGLLLFIITLVLLYLSSNRKQ